MRANILQKVLTTVLALTTALSMAACGGKPAGASVPADASGSGVSSAVEQPREESSAAEESKTSSSAAEEAKISSSTAEEPKTSSSAAEESQAPSSSAAESSEPESSGAQVLAMDAPSWETQLVSFDNVTFELPASWKKDEERSNDTVLLYSPGDTGSCINIISVATPFDGTISDLFEYLPPTTETILAENYGGASNFKAEPIKLPCGDAVKMSYRLNGGINMDMTQCYILTSSNVSVTVSKLDEELTPPIDEVAAYMLYTLKEV